MFLIFDLEFTFISSGFALIKKKTDNKLNPIIKKRDRSFSIKNLLRLIKKLNLKNKIKIYFFHPYSGYGGADLSISRLINGLDKKYFDIDFLSINSPKISKIFKKIKYKRISSSRTIFAFKKLNKLLKKIKIIIRKFLFQIKGFCKYFIIIFLKNLKI